MCVNFQLFMKRLRKKHKHKIRFFHCGEYGEKNQRPHYHALIYNHDFSDKRLFKERKNIKLYTSKELEELWPYGFSTIGDVTFQSSAYVARYIMKKTKKAITPKNITNKNRSPNRGGHYNRTRILHYEQKTRHWVHLVPKIQNRRIS